MRRVSFRWRARRTPARAVALVCAVALAAGWVVTAGERGAPALTPGFTQSGIVGGGFVNVVAAGPSGSGLLLAGGDVSGLHRSTDFGDTWQQVNVGVTGIDQLKVAAVAFSPTTPGEAFAAVGDEGRNGGFLASTDYGRTWELRSSVPQFSGGNNDGWPTLPQKHPRSTGRLIAFDGVRGLIYVATFEQGVLRSADGGYTWTPLGYAGRFLRTIAIDPADPDTLYVAAYGEGIFRTTTARTTGTFTKLSSTLTKVEDLLPIGTSLYAAAGPAGIFRSVNGGASWTELGGTTIPSSGPIWMSIDGYVACGQTVLYAGAEHGGTTGVMRSTDGGATWGSLVADPTRMHDEIGGPGGEPWWLTKPAFLPGGWYYTASMVMVDPADPPAGECLRRRVFLAGRSGIWRATDAGTDWYPAIRGLGVSIAHGVAFDPAVSGRTYFAMADWVDLYSNDDGDHVVQRRPAGGSVAFDVEVNAGSSPQRLFVASGSGTSNSGGEVYSAPSATLGDWTDEGLSTVASGARPLAIAVRQVGTARVLVVATQGDGIWRKSGVTWTHVSTAAMQGFQGTNAASMVWPPGPNIYLFDHDSGVWRSSNNGKTWVRIWTRRSGAQLTGFIASDPAASDRLYVSVGNQGLFRIDDADVGSVGTGEIVPVEIGTFPRPGAITVDPGGALYVATLAQGGPAELYRSSDLGASFTSVGDLVYSGGAGYVSDLEFSPSGQLFVATNGDGVLHGAPAP
jgi:hypothetical protein